MNRGKYIKDASYKDGYTDGYREGVNTVISIYENNIQKFVNDFKLLNENLTELKMKTFESQAESEVSK